MDKHDEIEKEFKKLDESPGEDVPWKTDYMNDKSETSYRIAKYLVDSFHVKTISEQTREIYIYDHGVYLKGEDTLRKWLQDILEEECKMHAKHEIIEKLKDLSVVSRKDFAVDKNFINLENGIFDIGAGELLPHDPKYLFFTKIPINYARDTDCLQIKKFLRGVLDREDILVIQEWAGYLLYRMYFIKKAMIFVGEQDTGKTTLLSLLIKFIGEKNVSSISLQRMASDKFAAADLYNRYLNAYDDLSFYDLKDNGAFKMATGGGYISGEYKFGNRFPFQNYSKLTYACNQIPDVTNADDEAYFGRWILIRFNREIKRLNNNLIQEVTTPEELSGFLNFALIGLTRLLKNRKFSYDKEPEDIKKEMMLSGSSLASFAANCLMPDADGWASKDDLYEAYRQYAIAGNLTVITKENFGRKIKNYAPYIEDRKRSVFGKQMTGWGNIKLLDVESTDQPDLDDIPDLTDQGATAPEKEDGRDNTLL